MKTRISVQERLKDLRVEMCIRDRVNTLGQEIFCNRPGKNGVILEHGQAVVDTVPHAAFLGALQHGLDSVSYTHLQGAESPH